MHSKGVKQNGNWMHKLRHYISPSPQDKVSPSFSSLISLLVFTPNASWEWGNVAQMRHCITPEECRMGNYGDKASLEGYSQLRKARQQLS